MQLPWAFFECHTDILVELLAHMLELLIRHNDQVVLTQDALTRFHSRAAPAISVNDYLARIVKYTNCEKIPLLSLLSYIDITCLNLPSFTLSSLTVHRFLIASICAGSKAQCDVFCTNTHYAKVGGIKTAELNALERELLKVTEWDLCCRAETLQKYYTSLIRSHGGYTQAPAPPESSFLSSVNDTYPQTEVSTEENQIERAQTDRKAKEDEDLVIESSPSCSPSFGIHDRKLSNIVQTETSSIPEDASPSLRNRSCHRRQSSHMDIDSPTQSHHHLSNTSLLVGDSPHSGASSSVPSSSRSRSRESKIARKLGKGIVASGVKHMPRSSLENDSVPAASRATRNVDCQGQDDTTMVPSSVQGPELISSHSTPQSQTPAPLSQDSSLSQPLSQSHHPSTHPHIQGHSHTPHTHKFFKQLSGSFHGIFARRKSMQEIDSEAENGHFDMTQGHKQDRLLVGESIVADPGEGRRGTKGGKPESVIPLKLAGIKPPRPQSHHFDKSSRKSYSSFSPVIDSTPTAMPLSPHSRPAVVTSTTSGPNTPSPPKPVTPRVRMRDETSLEDLHQN
nr:alternative cyclin Pho80 [Cryptococcus depauperatus CBS 7841]